MLYMNDYDLLVAEQRFSRGRTPRRADLARVVLRLAYYADENSDGWAYWPKPARAARKAMEAIQSTTSAANAEQEASDITEAERRAALAPIKAFLTRQNVSQHWRTYVLGT